MGDRPIGLGQWCLRGLVRVPVPGSYFRHHRPMTAKKSATGLTRCKLDEEQGQDINAIDYQLSSSSSTSIHFTSQSSNTISGIQATQTNQVFSTTNLQYKMVAVPMIGAGPYGTSPKSARSSTSAKLDASEVENIFQQVNLAREQASSSSSRPSWFSRQ